MNTGSIVDEEYNKALHTDSFLDIWQRAHNQLRIHHQLKRTISISATTATTSSSSSSSHTSDREDEDNEGITKASPPLSLRYYAHLPDFLLDPNQETLLASTSSHGHPHRLLLEYFDTTIETCNRCTSLLAGIDRTRTNQRSLHRLLRCGGRNLAFFSELASYLQLENPLSTGNLSDILRTHSLYSPLLRRLKAAHRRLALQARLLRCIFAVTCGALAVAMPMVTSAAAQVDAAAKGLYIVGRYLDTMSQMVRRLNVDVEHEREVLARVLQSRKTEVVRELVREVESGEVSEQLDELEEHVYLCLLNINRSRRMVVVEMGVESD